MDEPIKANNISKTLFSCQVDLLRLIELFLKLNLFVQDVFQINIVLRC